MYGKATFGLLALGIVSNRAGKRHGSFRKTELGSDPLHIAGGGKAFACEVATVYTVCKGGQLVKRSCFHGNDSVSAPANLEAALWHCSVTGSSGPGSGG